LYQLTEKNAFRFVLICLFLTEHFTTPETPHTDHELRFEILNLCIYLQPAEPAPAEPEPAAEPAPEPEPEAAEA